MGAHRRAGPVAEAPESVPLALPAQPDRDATERARRVAKRPHPAVEKPGKTCAQAVDNSPAGALKTPYLYVLKIYLRSSPVIPDFRCFCLQLGISLNVKPGCCL
jgi:hypothetical protein